MKRLFHKNVRQVFLTTVLIGVAILAWLHWWGVPGWIKGAVLGELAKRGINAEIESLSFDPWRGLVAEKMTVRLPGADQFSFQADEVRLEIGMTPLLKGHVVVEALEFSDSVFAMEIAREDGGTYPLEVRDVNGTFGFDAEQTLLIKELWFKFLNVSFDVKGSLGTRHVGPRPAPEPRKPLVLKKQWIDLLDNWQKATTTSPLVLEVGVSGDIRKKESIAVTVKLRGQNVHYGALQIQRARGEIRYKADQLEIDHLALETPEGSVEVTGRYAMLTRDADLQLSGQITPPLLSHFLPAGKLKYLEGWQIAAPFALEVSAEARDGRWNEAKASLQFHAGEFSYKSVPFKELRVKASWEGGRLTVPELILARAEGSLSAVVEWDRSTDMCNFILDSTVNLDDFEPMFGEGAKNAFKTFTLGKAPIIALKGSLIPKDVRSLKASGSLNLTDCDGNGISLKSFRCNLDVDGPVIRFTKVECWKKEGRMTGDFTLNTATGDLTMKAVSDIYPVEVAAIIGPRTKASIEPYHFKAVPHILWNGVYNLKDHNLHNLTIDVTCAKFNWWKLNMENLKARVWVGPKSIEISRLTSRFHEGTLKGEVLIDVTEKDSKVGFSVDLDQVNFRPLTEDLFGYKEVNGKLTGYAWAAGVGGKAETWVGDGWLKIEEGELWKIPIFGGLSKALGTIIPGFGSPKARYAETKFTLKDSAANMDDIKIDSLVVTLTAKGRYYFDERLDFIVQPHLLRKLFFIGWFLDPVTKIAELRLTGTLKKWEWSTAYIPMPKI